MATARDTGRQGVERINLPHTPSTVSRKVVNEEPSGLTSGNRVEVDSDSAFIELTDRVLAKARAVQRDPKRRRPSLRFR